MPVRVRDAATPWRNEQELSKVRRQLFSGIREGEPDEREDACRLVAVWRIRGHLPHAVDATALLTEAVLLDEKNAMSNVAIRLLYSGAFCRFVTGLVDTGQGKPQKSARYGPRIRKMSMFDRAKQLKLPASFVDLRHQATHEELPTMPALRQAVKLALGWVWKDFWMDQCPPLRHSISKISEAPRLRHKIEEYYEFVIAERKRCTQPSFNDKATDTSRELVRICKGGEGTLMELAIIMIEWGLMVPDTGRNDLHEPIDDTFLMWDPLITKLCLHQQPFLKALTDQMSIQLALPSGPMDISLDRYREVIAMWLQHIFTTKQYVSTVKRGKYDINQILSTCVNCQNYWTVQLARCIMAAPGYEATKKNYKDRVDSAIPHLAAGPNPSIVYRAATGTKDGNDEALGVESLGEETNLVREELYIGPWQPLNKDLWRCGMRGNLL